MTSSGEFYDIKMHQQLQAYLETAFKKADKSYRCFKIFMENPENASKIGYHKPEGELVFLPSMIDQGEKHKSTSSFSLQFDIYATSPVSRGDLYIDAITGEALYYNATI
jgi:hypothetical protein